MLMAFAGEMFMTYYSIVDEKHSHPGGLIIVKIIPPVLQQFSWGSLSVCS
jgi:hypothetical protein